TGVVQGHEAAGCISQCLAGRDLDVAAGPLEQGGREIERRSGVDGDGAARMIDGSSAGASDGAKVIDGAHGRSQGGAAGYFDVRAIDGARGTLGEQSQVPGLHVYGASKREVAYQVGIAGAGRAAESAFVGKGARCVVPTDSRVRLQ